MNSLSAHALRSLIIARKKTGGPASDLGESDPRFGGRVRTQSVDSSRPLCAKSGRSLTAWRTRPFDPLVPLTSVLGTGGMRQKAVFG